MYSLPKLDFKYAVVKSLFMVLPLRHKLLQQCQTLLRRIPPQHRTQGINRHLTLAEVGAVADVPNVRLQLFDDLLRVRQLLR